MNELLARLLFFAGVGHFCVLIASAMVPVRLNWREEFRSLSPLHRQMYWVYGGYVVLSIVALGCITVWNAQELAAGGALARSFCAYGMIFWGIRISLQPVLQVKQHLTTWWLTAGYHGLTVVFLFFTVVFGWGAWRIGI